jgi:hypothetical protein
MFNIVGTATEQIQLGTTAETVYFDELFHPSEVEPEAEDYGMTFDDVVKGAYGENHE